ncbi:MAG TPA: hypothetical protein VMT46_06400 [Anaerolineaceae bacterium]|nr:hypothetical protein [Anaerolineaceae bacterium]
MADYYDIVFIGHVCFDEIQPTQGEVKIAPGGAVLWGAITVGRMGKLTAAVVRLSPQDENLLDPLTSALVDVYAVPALETSYSRIVHLSSDPDERMFTLVRNAGMFSLVEIPKLVTHWMVLAGISDQEFPPDLLESLLKRGHRVAYDWQSSVRQVDLITGEISMGDVASKREIASQIACSKLDINEALVLTGTDDPLKAAKVIAAWGCPEGIITWADGILAWANGEYFQEALTNHSQAGRTGRGDTAFGAYLARRLDHDPEDALRFAAVLTSMKLEKPYPFSGTLDAVLERMGG